jgi:hypothetical protein
LYSQGSQTKLNFRHVLAEVALPQLKRKIQVVLFPFASRSFLANNLCFLAKFIEKAMLVVVKMHIQSNLSIVVTWVD